MKTIQKLITPEWAKDVLENHNPNNRKLSDNTVLAYAIDMENNRWTLTHQGIAFDEDDNLVDGQHRLSAVVLSGVSVEMLVTTGIPVQEKRNGVILKPMDSIDRNLVRSVGQQLQLAHGYKNGTNVAACCAAIAKLCYPHRARRISTGTTLFILSIFGKEMQAMLSLLDTRHMQRHFTGPATLFFAIEPDLTTQFIHQWMTLENARSPVRTMIKWMERNHHGGMHPDSAMKIVCSCLYHFVKGHDLLKVYPSDEARSWLLDQHKSPVQRIRKCFSGLMSEIEAEQAITAHA